MAKVRKPSKESSKSFSSPFKEYWNKFNYSILYVGLGIIVLGYILMAQPPWDNPISLTISPIVLIFSYLVIIPISILIKIHKR